MTARNRELVILALAGVVASGAFASAWFREAAAIDYGWVPWAVSCSLRRLPAVSA